MSKETGEDHKHSFLQNANFLNVTAGCKMFNVTNSEGSIWMSARRTGEKHHYLNINPLKTSVYVLYKESVRTAL
jgi:hypothetical protein